MPSRDTVARDLAEIFKVLAHPDRIRMIEELRARERDVNSLAAALSLPSARVSQHLSLLRAHRLVGERREGRRRFYRLSQPGIAEWIIVGLDFVEGRNVRVNPAAISAVRKQWAAST